MSLQQAIKEAAEYNNVNFRSYSGRGMYGRSCVGITGSHSDCMQVISAVIQEAMYTLAEETDDEKVMSLLNEKQQEVDILLNFNTDSMGRRDIVLYWQELAMLEDVEETEE